MADDSDRYLNRLPSFTKNVCRFLFAACLNQPVYKCISQMQALLSVDVIMDPRQAKGMGVYPLLLCELQTADVHVYRGRQLHQTEIQLLYTSHIGRHSMPEHLIKDLSSEGLYRPSTPWCCLHRPITAIRLWKKTFQNRTCASHWKVLSKGENLRKFSWHTQNFLLKTTFEENFPVCHDLHSRRAKGVSHPVTFFRTTYHFEGIYMQSHPLLWELWEISLGLYISWCYSLGMLYVGFVFGSLVDLYNRAIAPTLTMDDLDLLSWPWHTFR